MQPVAQNPTTVAPFMAVEASLPLFLMALITGTSLNRFRTNHEVRAFLWCVAPAVVGMLAAAGVSLARSGLDSTVSFGVATTAFLLMLRARLKPVVIILGGGGLRSLPWLTIFFHGAASRTIRSTRKSLGSRVAQA